MVKKSFVIVVALFTALVANAQLVALHTPEGVQIHKGISALINAYNQAQSGDTIYISGGSYNSPVNIDKKLIVFGAGHYADASQATTKTFILGDIRLHENADDSHIEGVEITGHLLFENNHSVNNVTIKRCKINGEVRIEGNMSNPSSNVNLIGNVFVGHLRMNNANNFLISNNIINRTITNTNGNYISNNIVLGFLWGSSMDYLFTGDNNTLNNNIFIWDGYSADAGGAGNVFNNNIYVEPTPNYGAGSTSNNNYVNIPQSDIFVNQTGGVFDYIHNYHLKTPETFTGTDGTEVGIYGGLHPYKEGAIPSNPHIESKNIAASTDADGNLKIEIKVTSQKD